MNSCFETNLANLTERVDFGLLMLSLMRTDRAAKLGSVMCDSAPEKPVLTTQARHQRVRPILSQSPPHATRPALPSEIDRGAPAQRGPGVQAQAHKDPAGLVGVRLLASTSVPSGTASGREGRFRAAVSEEQRSHGAPECQSHRRSVNLLPDEDGIPRKTDKVAKRRCSRAKASGPRPITCRRDTRIHGCAGHFPRTPKTDSHHISAPPIDDDGSSPVVLGCLKDSARL